MRCAALSSPGGQRAGSWSSSTSNASRRTTRPGLRLNAVQTINPRARQEADRLDAAFKSSGPVGPLHCIPVLVKDQVDTSDMPTTYGSAVFKDFVPQKDATVVTRLRKAGAVIVGKATHGRICVRVLRLRIGTHSQRV